ncbi:MAG: hypothetical protein PHD97_01730 [Bacteroidales bacterium]|nr:hypothetical protein [Bacteroidales bacterium]
MEKQIKEKKSYYIGLSFDGPFSIVLGSRNSNFDDIRTDFLRGLTASSGIKHYLSKSDKPLTGLYISPFVDLSYYSTSPWEDKSAKTNVIEGHLSCFIGYQIIKEHNFVMDFYTGLGIQVKNYDINSDPSYTGLGIKPYLSLSLGNKF